MRERGDDENGADAEEQEHAASQRHVEEKDCHRHGDGEIDQPDGEVGQEFSEDELRRAHRRGDELLHRAGFPFAGDGEGREQCGDQSHDDREDAGNDEVAAGQIGVEPDAGAQIESGAGGLAGAAADLVERELLVEGKCDGLGVAEDEAGGVGVGAIDDGLHGGGAAGVEIAAEAGRDDEREHGLARIDGAFELRVVFDRALQAEIRRAGESGDQFSALRGAALVPDDEGHAVHVEREGVAEGEEHQ